MLEKKSRSDNWAISSPAYVTNKEAYSEATNVLEWSVKTILHSIQ